MSRGSLTTLTIAASHDGLLHLVGPRPGPAGGASVLIGDALRLEFDAAEPGVVTRVELDPDDVRPVELAVALGSEVAGLIGGEPGRSAIVTPGTADVRWLLARLALLELVRWLPRAPLYPQHHWAVEALSLAHEAERYGFDFSSYAGEQASVAAPYLVDQLRDLGPNRAAESPFGRAARRAIDALTVDYESFLALSRLVADLPDPSLRLSALLEEEAAKQRVRTVAQPVERIVRAPRDPSDGLPPSSPVIWSLLGTDISPPDDQFARAVRHRVGDEGATVDVEVDAVLSASAPRVVIARVVREDERTIESAGALTATKHGYRGSVALPDAFAAATHRVEAVRDMSASILSRSDWLAEVGRQWALVASAAERAGDRAAAAGRWDAAADAYRAAGDDERAAASEELRDSGGRGDSLPFLVELGVV